MTTIAESAALGSFSEVDAGPSQRITPTPEERKHR